MRSEERREGKESREDETMVPGEDGIRDYKVTGVQTCALPIFAARAVGHRVPGWGEKSIERHGRIVDAFKRRDAAGATTAALGAVDAAEAEILTQLEGAARSA